MRKRFLVPDDDLEVISEWLGGVSSNTALFYADDVQALFNTARKPLRAITQADIAQVITGTPTVARRRLSAIRSLFKFAYEAQHVAANVALGVRHVAPEPARIMPSLPEQTVMDLLRQANGSTRCLIGLMYYCAVTAQEVADMRWSHISKTKPISLNIGSPHQRRTIIPDIVWDELVELRKTAENDVVFPSRIGGRPLDPNSVRGRVRRYGQLLGLELKPQKLRNSHARHAIAHGVSLNRLQASLGHTSNRTTARHFDKQIGGDAPLALRKF